MLLDEAERWRVMAEVESEQPLDDEFAILATPHQFGDDLTEAEIEAGSRVVRAFWPKGGKPHKLPEKYR